jgi:hypothetical protein
MKNVVFHKSSKYLYSHTPTVSQSVSQSVLFRFHMDIEGWEREYHYHVTIYGVRDTTELIYNDMKWLPNFVKMRTRFTLKSDLYRRFRFYYTGI